MPDLHAARRGEPSEPSALTEGRGEAALGKDATLDCHCGLPSFPVAREGEPARYDRGMERSDVPARRGAAARRLRYECANRHARLVAPPADRRLRRLVDNWLDKRSSQLDEQHRRREEERL